MKKVESTNGKVEFQFGVDVEEASPSRYILTKVTILLASLIKLS